MPAAAYCAVSAPTGSWLWLRVQSSCSVLLVPAILCQCQSCSQASSLSQHGGKPGLAAEQAALGGQAAEADIAEWSPAWPEEWRVVRASGGERRPAERQATEPVSEGLRLRGLLCTLDTAHTGHLLYSDTDQG